MDKYYLVDYENTGVGGLAGCGALTEEDRIILFFTKNASKIDMSAITDTGGALLKMIEVPAGKQSVDMHISSYLGYLIASQAAREYVVVSRDTDFDNVIRFWTARSSVTVSRQAQISPDDPAEEPKDDRTALNNGIMKTLSKAGFPSEVIGYTTSTVVKNMGTKNAKQKIYRTIVSKFGQKQGLAVYDEIKKSL